MCVRHGPLLGTCTLEALVVVEHGNDADGEE